MNRVFGKINAHEKENQAIHVTRTKILNGKTVLKINESKEETDLK